MRFGVGEPQMKPINADPGNASLPKAPGGPEMAASDSIDPPCPP